MNARWLGSLAAMAMSLLWAASIFTPPTQAADDLPDCPICDSFDFANYTGPLEDPELLGLLRALNDEYHAWAVYDQVIADHGEQRPFTNIRRSEQRHIERLLPLFESYAVSPIPDNPWVGEAPSFDTIGLACEAGVDAELVNIDLYDRIFVSTTREDVLTVYRDLRRASLENHLPAFERCSSGAGGGGAGGGPGGGPNRANLTERAYLPQLTR